MYIFSFFYRSIYRNFNITIYILLNIIEILRFVNDPNALKKQFCKYKTLALLDPFSKLWRYGDRKNILLWILGLIYILLEYFIYNSDFRTQCFKNGNMNFIFWNIEQEIINKNLYLYQFNFLILIRFSSISWYIYYIRRKYI